MTYAQGEVFENSQRLLHESLETAEIQEHWAWNASSFQGGRHGAWYERHRDANFRRGGAWKPYVIFQALRRVHWGDWLVYHDSSQYVKEGFGSSVQPVLAWLERNREQNPCECIAAQRLRQTLQWEYEQRCVPPYSPVPRDMERQFDIFCGLQWRLGTCSPSEGPDCCRRMWRAPTHQHAWSVWRKNRQSARFLREWAKRASEYEIVAHLPLVDQSVNALLILRWHKELGIRTLWAPSLYRGAWHYDGDLSGIGQNDGNVFKHINDYLTALWNQEATRTQQLWLLDPAEEVPDSPYEVYSWDADRVPRSPWLRSLCVPPPGQPPVAAKALSAALKVQLPEGWGGYEDGVLVRFSGRFKASVASWPESVYIPPDPGELPAGGAFQQALVEPPRGSAIPGGEEALFAKGLSDAVFLGAWRIDRLRSVARDLMLLAEIVLCNVGAEPWPPGVRVCPAGVALGVNASDLDLKARPNVERGEPRSPLPSRIRTMPWEAEASEVAGVCMRGRAYKYLCMCTCGSERIAMRVHLRDRSSGWLRGAGPEQVPVRGEAWTKLGETRTWTRQVL